ncbi:MAG: bifunctional methylenetetrahydrofolate dehydrogenase/methenyltetrahydrofolate cyclohydrolase FolD [Planctomycetota bacterium]|nr:bifunctional methylenetetrahydrofolate dehydrogenase/methenyltetrahydrofolate cyclohydrolase FolD [Planctomycetota bacterium]MDA0919097.1 bifunctional methylenetetrahydrofolate dehydrogenase/methenyltetrahydrofolate cyclohydrolase FolD [Planctomycetota bacterium]MDA1158670.1 bifunctional methylenetetrahydrofolate dehydrogenase/methenyltetrahydrofolate cyclohydrolase FolD [Planctomycetota bacterium]
MAAAIIDGKAVAADLRATLAGEVSAFVERTNVQPHLAALLVGEDPASAVYVRNKQRACDKSGIRSTLHRLPTEITEAGLLSLISQLNNDPTVHGILVQLPLPTHIQEQVVLDAVTPLKDVDCFHPENVGLMVQGRPRFLPCTPHGVQQLLLTSGTQVAGAHAVVLGRSEIVGKPMAMMLVQRGEAANATVTVCHRRTQGLAEITRQADIIVAAIGKPRFVTADMVKPGAVVIDVGINRVDDQLVGDVDFEPVSEVASAITPVPGGVGPMTIAMLLQNTLTAAKISVG